jgi:phage terminase large subunit-like protein
VPTITPELPETDVRPGFRVFVELAEAAGLQLEPFQRRIARAVFDGPREVLILLARGQGKTCLLALIALHHLLTVEDAEIFCCASSRDQARILFQYAARFARELDHPERRPPPPRGPVVRRPRGADRLHPLHCMSRRL